MKRILAIVLGAMFIASSLVAQTPAPPKPPSIGWVGTMMTRHDQLLYVRVRNEIPAGVEPAKYPNVIQMHWKYVPDSKDMPTDRELSRIEKLEADIDPIQGDRAGYLMMIVTGNGERTWLWYVADPKAFGDELNRLIPNHPYPITLNATGKEPDWTTYRAMRGKVH
jgi:hypothetical protein